MSQNVYPLHMYAARGETSSVLYMLQSKVDPNITDNYGDTVLSEAVCGGHDDVVRLLLEYGSDLDQLNERYGQTALCAALYSRKAEKTTGSIKILLEAGCDANLPFKNGKTPLIYAIKNARMSKKNVDYDLVRLLIQYCDVNRTDREKKTPLYHAVSDNCILMVRMLLDAGCDTNICDVEGYAPLHIAMYGIAINKNNVDSVDALLHAHCDLELKDAMSCSPIHLAIEMELVQVVEKLIQANCNLEVLDEYLDTPLQVAIGIGSVELVEKLLAAGSNIHAKDGLKQNTLKTALMYKGRNIHGPQVVSLLQKAYEDYYDKLLSAIIIPNNESDDQIQSRFFSDQDVLYLLSKKLIESELN